MKHFLESVAAAAERYRGLPDKFIDTKILFLCQFIICLTVGVSILDLLQNSFMI
jgi:hypothetical protein